MSCECNIGCADIAGFFMFIKLENGIYTEG